MSEKTKLVVADVYNLSRIGKKFDEDISRAAIKFKAHTVERSYAEEMNEHWQIRGKKYVIDEEASIDAQEAREKAAEERLERDEARLLAAKAVTSIAMGVNKSGKSKKPKADSTPKIDEALEAARERYQKLFDKKPHHATKLSTIIEACEEKEAELNDN